MRDFEPDELCALAIRRPHEVTDAIAPEEPSSGESIFDDWLRDDGGDG